MHPRSYLAASALLLGALGCRDDTESLTEPRAATQGDLAAATALAFWQVSADDWHTCGVTTDYRAYCWGQNHYGQLGVGTETGLAVRPTLVAGGLRFRHVSAGLHYSCGVTTDYRAYCWGLNQWGQLGEGTTAPERQTPTAVAGGLRFRLVEAGERHTCGVTYPDNRAYCWGWNDYGELGDGTGIPSRVPVAVRGNRAFRQVSAAYGHTCGVTTGDVAFCWGYNRSGQLGDSTEVKQRLQPTRVAGGHRFRQVDAGGAASCGVTTRDRAYCWGSGGLGQLGTGKTYNSFWPRAVSGRLLFKRVSVGGLHTCGETTTSRAYCWGANYYGQLGDGTGGILTYRLRPVAVVGGIYFKQLSAGVFHTCGKTSTGVGYCWGRNDYHQLGDGTQTHRWTPTRVADPL